MSNLERFIWTSTLITGLALITVAYQHLSTNYWRPDGIYIDPQNKTYMTVGRQDVGGVANMATQYSKINALMCAKAIEDIEGDELLPPPKSPGRPGVLPGPHKLPDQCINPLSIKEIAIDNSKASWIKSVDLEWWKNTFLTGGGILLGLVGTLMLLKRYHERHEGKEIVPHKQLEPESRLLYIPTPLTLNEGHWSNPAARVLRKEIFAQTDNPESHEAEIRRLDSIVDRIRSGMGDLKNKPLSNTDPALYAIQMSSSNLAAVDAIEAERQIAINDDKYGI